MMPKIYIVKTLVNGQAYYLKFLNAGGTFSSYDKSLDNALWHTKDEMEYVKKWHLPNLGRWVLLDAENKRAKSLLMKENV